MRTPSPSWCGLDLTHLWPTGSSLGDPLITARNFSSCPSDSILRWTPCPPETASDGFRFVLAVSDFRLRARLDFSTFGVVVKIEHVLIHCPSASFHPSQSPAKANNSPSLTSKQKGCLLVAARFR